jgi:hypothetical protein
MGRLPFPSVSGVAVALGPRQQAPPAPPDPPRRPAPEPAPLAHLGEAIRRWLEEEL